MKRAHATVFCLAAVYVFWEQNMAQRKVRKGALNERCLRDSLVVQAVNLANSLVATYGSKSKTILDGGGVHVGPPHGMPPRGHTKTKKAAPGYGFSFKLPVSASDDAWLEGEFKRLIGGSRKTFDPNGNEWGNGHS
jgi:hypothetical protein